MSGLLPEFFGFSITFNWAQFDWVFGVAILVGLLLVNELLHPPREDWEGADGRRAARRDLVFAVAMFLGLLGLLLAKPEPGIDRSRSMGLVGWIAAAAAVGLLGYEFYRRVASAGAKAPPAPVSPVAAPAAEQRKASGSLESPPMIMAGHVRLHRGQRYRMRYHAPSFHPSSMGGWQRITVYATPASLPKDWPPELATRSDPDTAWASATWVDVDVSQAAPYGLWQVWPTDSEA